MNMLKRTMVMMGLLGFAAVPAYAGDLISIPLRWCVVGNDANQNGRFDAGEAGAPAFTNPGGVTDGNGKPEVDTDGVLWRRHERASDRTWIPGAQITFRSAIFWNVVQFAHFPIIADPDTAVGRYGDVVVDNSGNSAELTKVKNACRDAWIALVPKLRTALNDPGFDIPASPIAVNIRHFVDANGANVGLSGRAGSDAISGNYCTSPEGLTSVALQWVVIQDNQELFGSSANIRLRDADPDESILAHEVGHALLLEHGNGLDDSNPKNGLFDGYPPGGGCDAAEADNATPFTIMTSGQYQINQTLATAITKGGGTAAAPGKPSQAFTARGAANKTPGKTLDPPGVLIPGDVIGLERFDAFDDVSNAAVDLISHTVVENTAAQVTSFIHELRGNLPGCRTSSCPRFHNQYVVFVDLDGNPSTGGAPSLLGFDTFFQGAELVAKVEVGLGGGEIPVFFTRSTVWTLQLGLFVIVTDPAIRARVSTAFDAETGAPLNDTVVIEMPNAVRGARSQGIRIQAIAQELTSPGQLDRLPDSTAQDTPDGGLALSTRPPSYPVCSVTPFQVRPGNAASLSATGLVPNQIAKVIFGDLFVTMGVTDGTGALNLNFVVPADAVRGPRLLTVGSMGTALTADCSLEVFGDPVPATPVLVDVRPRSCPNAFNVGLQGRVPVAITGSSTIDVQQIDPTTITVEGVQATRWAIEDVATNSSSCSTAGADGFADLSLSFDAQALAAALGATTKGQTVVLDLKGNLLPEFGGTPIIGQDVVVIR